MTYDLKNNYLMIVLIALVATLLTGCRDSKNVQQVTIIKNNRSSEKHPEYEIQKETEISNNEITRDTFKEITDKQQVKILNEETSLPLSDVKNTSDHLDFGIAKNKKEIAALILSNFKDADLKKRPLRIAYFNPGDRKPIPEFQNRIQKIMTELQSFYGKGMEMHGFGNRTFDLEMNGNKLQIHFIQSKKTKNSFSRNNQTSQYIYEAASQQLKSKGINIENETVIVFQNLARIENNSFFDTDAPYYGTWNTNKNRKGFCYVVDSKFLDWRNLSENKKKFTFNGQRTMTLGELASGQIGGVCHELGHAFCLNHTCDSHKVTSQNGTALMGYGNWTFKEELRQKGKGTYLSFISAVKLMGHPCFSQLSYGPLKFQITDLSLNSMNRILDLSGHIKANPEVYAVIAYCDNLNKKSDYDATGWVGAVDNMGNFQISINELLANTPYKLNLQFLHTNGKESSESIVFKTDNSGVPVLEKGLREKIILKPVIKDKLDQKKKLNDLLRTIQSSNKQKSISFLTNTIKLLDYKAELYPHEVPTDTKSIYLSQTKWSKAVTGYNAPRNNCVHEDNRQRPWPFLMSEEKIHRFGLYAHANSEYIYELKGKWKTLTGSCSLRKGMKGSVTFIIKGDGKELFNSSEILHSNETPYSVNLTGIKTLSLIVHDNNNGKNSDWGQWLSPKISR